MNDIDRTGKAARSVSPQANHSESSNVSDQEVESFKKYGFLVKKRLLDPSLVFDALQRTWAYLLENVPVVAGSRLCRDDSQTWVNPKWEAMPPPDKSGFYEGRQRTVYQGSTVKLHDFGSAKFLVDLIPNCEWVRSIAEALMGGPLRESRRTRGVYVNFPSEPPINKLGPHSDRVCQQLNVCAYLDDVPARNGGFTVYPGSHRVMHFAHKFEANWSPLPNFRDFVHKVAEEIQPYEFSGNAGDVMFWHGRSIHSAGIHTGSKIRWAVFADFSQDRPVLSDEEHRELGQYEWFKDTKLFREDLPVTQNMWRSWNI